MKNTIRIDISSHVFAQAPVPIERERVIFPPSRMEIIRFFFLWSLSRAPATSSLLPKINVWSRLVDEANIRKTCIGDETTFGNELTSSARRLFINEIQMQSHTMNNFSYTLSVPLLFVYGLATVWRMYDKMCFHGNNNNDDDNGKLDVSLHYTLSQKRFSDVWKCAHITRNWFARCLIVCSHAACARMLLVLERCYTCDLRTAMTFGSIEKANSNYHRNIDIANSPLPPANASMEMLCSSVRAIWVISEGRVIVLLNGVESEFRNEWNTTHSRIYGKTTHSFSLLLFPTNIFDFI